MLRMLLILLLLLLVLLLTWLPRQPWGLEVLVQ
jgi:hypothetical protein